MTKQQYIINATKQLQLLEKAKANITKCQKMISRIENLKNTSYKIIEFKSDVNLLNILSGALLIKMQRADYSVINYYRLTTTSICEIDEFSYNTISSENIIDGDIEETFDIVDFFISEIKRKMEVLTNDYTSNLIINSINKIENISEDDLEDELIKYSTVINIATYYAC